MALLKSLFGGYMTDFQYPVTVSWGSQLFRAKHQLNHKWPIGSSFGYLFSWGLSDNTLSWIFSEAFLKLECASVISTFRGFKFHGHSHGLLAVGSGLGFKGIKSLMTYSPNLHSHTTLLEKTTSKDKNRVDYVSNYTYFREWSEGIHPIFWTHLDAGWFWDRVQWRFFYSGNR